MALASRAAAVQNYRPSVAEEPFAQLPDEIALTREEVAVAAEQRDAIEQR